MIPLWNFSLQLPGFGDCVLHFTERLCVSESTGTSGTAAAFVLLSETMSLAGTWLKMRSKINLFLFYGEPHVGLLSVLVLFLFRGLAQSTETPANTDFIFRVSLIKACGYCFKLYQAVAQEFHLRFYLVQNNAVRVTSHVVLG